MELEKSEIYNMLPMNVIEPARTGWAFPVYFKSKKDVKLRFCIYQRNLNAVKLSDSYPLNRMYECMSSFGDAQATSILDAIRVFGRSK